MGGQGPDSKAIGEVGAEAIVVTTVDDRVLAWNSAAERLYGIAAAEAVGRVLDDLLAIDGMRWTEHVGRRELMQHGAWQGVVRQAARSGCSSCVNWSLSRVSLPNLSTEIVVAVSRRPDSPLETDQTLRASERKRLSILRAAPVGIGMVVDRVLKEVNDRLCEMTGYTSEELLGQRSRLLYADDEEFGCVGEETQRQIAEKGTGTVETRWRKKSGENIEVLLSSTPLNPDRYDEGITFTALDITDKVRTIAELRASEARYRDLFENANDLILLVDEGGEILDANGRNREILGLDEVSLRGRHLASLKDSTGLDWTALGLLIEKALRSADSPQSIELACHRADDGTPVSVELNLRVIRKRNGNGRLLINVRDVTERAQARDALRESEAKFRSIVESSPMGIHLYSLEERGRLVLRDANPAADRILGVENCAFIGQAIEEAFPPLANTEIPERYRAAAARGELWSTERVDYRDGRITGAYEVHAFQTSRNRMAALFLDITPRLEAEKALREKTEEVDKFFSTALDLLCIADMSGRFRRLNPEWKRTLGYELDEMLGHSFLDFIHPDDVSVTRERLGELSAQRPVVNFTNRYRSRDGTYRWIEWRSFPTGDAVYSAARDVTERMMHEEALIERERLNRMIAEMASDYIFHMKVDAAGRAVMDYVSKSFTERTGRTLEQVADSGGWSALTAPEDLPTIVGALHRVIAERLPVEVECRSIVRGELLWSHVYLRPEVDSCRGIVVGIIGAAKDITDRKRMTEEQAKLRDQLQQAMKMEAIGRLAGGLAHDFNNLLTGIGGNVELVMMDLDSSSPIVASLQDVLKAARSAATLTQQLLAFSRKQMVEPKVINLNDLVGSLGNMLTRLIGEDIHLRIVAGPDLEPVKLDPGQFEQVVMNLVVNARDAMPNGGTLVIETANLELGDRYCELHPGTIPGRYVMLAVSDTGTGMSKEVLRSLFEPFFTTKPKGKGTGLGLATIYGTVKQAGGAIEVYSEVGEGSTFKIYLPCASEKAVKWVREHRSEDLPMGHEVVLLVEDENTVRDLAERVLSRLGYTVFAAKNGDEALTLAHRRTEPIDLLLTDVVMPGMSGRDLAGRLSARHPEAKVLYTSGYTENVVVHHGVVDEGLCFLGKPYSMRGLARKVRDVLDRPS